MCNLRGKTIWLKIEMPYLAFFPFGRELSNISDDLLRGILHKMPFGTPNREKYMRKLEKLIFQHDCFFPLRNVRRNRNTP